MNDSSEWSSSDAEEFEMPGHPIEDRHNKCNYQFRVYRPDQVLDHMNEVVEEVYDILGLSRSLVRILLHHFKWDRERLLENFFEEDNEQLLKQANIACVDLSDQSLSDDNSSVCSSFICDICLTDTLEKDSSSLRCKHRFCNNCWSSYLKSQILSEGRSDCIACPAQLCEVHVDDVLVKKLIQDSLVLARYQKLIARSFVENSKLLRWCPNPGCLNAIGVSYSAPMPVKCSCGMICCFQCGESWHDPIQCKLLKMWLLKCDDDSESANWLAANTKDCPGCQFPIEKRGGCNHMTCTNAACGFEFCWICLGPWKPHGAEWYECNRYNEDSSKKAQDAMERSRAALHRYLHYYNRYMNHMNSLKLENQLHKAVKLKMEYLQTNGMSWIEVQFLKGAVDVLLECRQTLMYTYAFAFYLKRNNQSDVFAQNQADLERATEDLSYHLEREFSGLNVGILKQWIQDKYRYCKSRRSVLVKHVHEGYEKEYWSYRIDFND